MKLPDSSHQAPASLDLDSNDPTPLACDPWHLLTPPPFTSACAAPRDRAELAPKRNRRGTKKRPCPKFR